MTGMVRAIDGAIVVVVVFIVIVAAFLSVPTRAPSVHFGFPSYQDISKLLTGVTVQSIYSMQNSSSPIASNEYGLVKAQSASYYLAAYATPVLPTVYITELNFNNQQNASSFYKAQLFGNILTSKLPVSNGDLNISYGGASYSIFMLGSVSQYYYYMIGCLGTFEFALFLYAAQSPQGTLNSLAELVVQSMK